MMTAPWVSYRPEIKVLDCTVRDGGLMNDHLFEDGLVKGVYKACVEAGIDYMELGYKNSKKLFAPESWNRLHLQIIFFGREHCPARGHVPADCPLCSKVGRKGLF